MPHVNKKALGSKQISVQTTFSDSTLELKQKFLRRKTTCFSAPPPLTASPKSSLHSYGVTKIITPI